MDKKMAKMKRKRKHATTLLVIAIVFIRRI